MLEQGTCHIGADRRIGVMPVRPFKARTLTPSAANLADVLRYSIALTLTLRAFSPEWVFYEDSIK
jgi:hypothetical protein